MRLSQRSFETLGFGEEDDASGHLSAEGLAHADKFGAFTIYVATKDYESTVKDLLKPTHDSDLDESVEGPDSDGIYWTNTCYLKITPTDCSYSAAKRFGKNVLLRWQAGEEKQTDSTWDRLVSILTDVKP